jgi:hypothetical protein
MDQGRQEPDGRTGHGGGRVLVGSHDKGAGIAVYPRLVITASHVVGGRQQDVPVTFKTEEERLVPAVGAVRFVEGRDAAALGLADDVAWSRLAVATDGDRWWVNATGRGNDPALTGVVTRADLRMTDDMGNRLAAMQLLVDQDLGGFGGYSGSAVLNPDGEVTGILIEQLPQRLSTPRPPASNVLFALPIADVLGRLPLEIPVPRIRPLRAVPTPADHDRPPQGYFLRECFAGLIDYYAQSYSTTWALRADVTGKLDSFIRNPAGGYLVIAAPPQSGKTALIAGLLNQRPERIAYHFFSQWYSDGGLDESFFLQDILQQLVFLLGRDEEIPESIGQLRAMYHHLMSQPADSPVTVVLDGVDEVTSWQLRPYLSRRLPDMVRVVITMQDEQASAAKYYIPAEQTTLLKLGTPDQLTPDDARIPAPPVTAASLLAGQQLNALLDQLQAQVLQTEGAAATEQALYEELRIESDANNAAAASVAQAAQHKMLTNAKIMEGFDQVLNG